MPKKMFEGKTMGDSSEDLSSEDLSFEDETAGAPSGGKKAQPKLRLNKTAIITMGVTLAMSAYSNRKKSTPTKEVSLPAPRRNPGS
ncbi:MAG TPA: hypothetical protein VNC84_06550 [Gammaproteobacteria bacterium]|jgi:hypothetical protein|nr:hypothetical protein [Gammaproteobacteria bacterium]